MIGGENATKSKKAWQQTYRALAHLSANDACRNQKMISKFPKPIEDFANTFVTMQAKRHSADYDPHSKFTKSEVINDITTVVNAIRNFESADTKDRRAFCAFVLFKMR